MWVVYCKSSQLVHAQYAHTPSFFCLSLRNSLQHSQTPLFPKHTFTHTLFQLSKTSCAGRLLAFVWEQLAGEP